MDLGRASGIVRLINTSDGGALCLAGDVTAEVVADFRRRHGREPHLVAAVDAGSVTGLSPEAVDLVLDHLDAASRRGRDIRVRRSPVVERLLAAEPARPLSGPAVGRGPVSRPGRHRRDGPGWRRRARRGAPRWSAGRRRHR